MDRKVRLIIEVDDKDVKATEASLNRLGVATKKVGDGEADVNKLTTGMSALSGVAGPLTAAVAAVSAAVVGLAAAAIRGWETMVSFTKSFTSYGVEIGKIQQLTGFTAEAISGLRVQVERTGGSVTDLGDGLKHFEKTIGDAANGSKTATATLRRLGVDGKAAITDLEGGFKQALVTIAKLPDGVQRTNAMIDLFGEAIGPKLLPAFRNFHGNIDELIKIAQELGLRLSQEDVRATRELDQAMKDLDKTILGLKVTLGREFAPTVEQTLKDFTGWVRDNRAEIVNWGKAIGTFVSGVIQGFKTIIEFYNSHPLISRILLGISSGGLSEVAINSGALVNSMAPATRSRPGTRDQIEGRTPPMNDEGYLGAQPKEPKAPRAGRTPKGPHEKAMKELGSMTTLRISTGNAQWDFWFEEMGHKFGVDPNVLLLQDGAESSFKSGAVSPKGAKGFSQFMPATAKRFGVDTSSVKDAIRGQSQYMGELLAMFGGDYRKALAGYNAGEGNVQKYHGIPPFKETQNYVAKIEAAYHAKVGTGTGGTKFGGYDPEKNLAEKSDRLTKDYHDQMVKAMIDAYEKAGVLPTDDLISDFHRMVVEEAKKRGERQPMLEELVQAFKDKMLTPLQGPLDIPLQARQLPADEQRVVDITAQLQLTERQTELDQKRDFFARDMSLLTQDYNLALQEQIQDTITENALLKNRNLAIEGSIALEQERNGLVREIGNLQIGLQIQGQNDQLKIQAAYMRDVLDMRDRELNAVIAINRAQLELSKAMEISNNQIRAGIYEHMEQQKTLNQGIVDGINGTYDAILRRMNEPLDKLNAKSKGLLSFVTEPLKALQAQGLNKVFGGIVDSIFPGAGSALEKAKNPVVGELKDHTKLLQQIAINTGGTGIAGLRTQSGGGGIWNQILHGGGSGQGPGGTPLFNPGGSADPGIGGVRGGPNIDSIGGGSGGIGGIFGNFKKMFGPRKNILTGQDSKLGGQLGGIGDIMSLAGSFVPGRGGKALSYAGMGLSIGSMFGPWGALIGGGIGALVGLFGHKDDAINKLKQAAASQYGINVTDKGVLKALNAVGEGMFGRGKVGANATAVVRSEEGMNILRAYAEQSGQSGLKIDRLNYGDSNWSGNDFRSSFGGFRASGGSVVAGRRYVIGERGPEMFVPAVSGTVMPNGASGIDKELVAGLAESIYQLRDEVAMLGTQPAGVIVKQGLETHPDAAADAYERTMADDVNRRGNLSRLRGEAV